MGPNFDSFGAQVVWLFKRTNQLNGVGDDNVACLDFEECARRPPARVRRAPYMQRRRPLAPAALSL